MIPLVEKAWEMCQATAHLPVQTICETTACLEKGQHGAPCGRMATVIALHYLILAFRHHGEGRSDLAQECCERAAHWQSLAHHSSAMILAARAEEN